MMLAFAMTLALTDEVVSTAPRDSAVAEAMVAPAEAVGATPTASDAQPHNLTTAEQIDRWIAARNSDRPTFIETAERPVDDRKMHGWVEAGIGTGGYRTYGAAVSLPIGENARLGLSYSESKNDYGYGYYDGYGRGGPGYGYGYASPFGIGESRRSASASFRWNAGDED
ncbi:MAG: hypothetical protein EON88_37900 [Brevundimonas sp.]|nr:MAG: hypothetical protein EON88_37900 [Brevundimonas sp.]